MGGRVQQKVGEYAGDAKPRRKGSTTRLLVRRSNKIARLSDVIRDQPIASALVAIGIGYLLGRFT